jgi:hypothetical protein
VARLKTFYLYPYSGWEELPWNQGRGATGPYDEATLDLDATARSSRRVFEAISQSVSEMGIDSKRSSYRLSILESKSSDLEVKTDLSYFTSGFLGHIRVPSGFRFVEPSLRAELLLGALWAAIRALADREGWDFRPVDTAVEKFRESRYECGWIGPWKNTRDRTLRARVVMRLADDGYGRWHMIVAGSETDELLVRTEEVLGWTWIENFVRLSKSMRFVAPRTLEVGSGSGFIDRRVQVNLETGGLVRRATDPTPLSYPGNSSMVLHVPELSVIADK